MSAIGNSFRGHVENVPFVHSQEKLVDEIKSSAISFGDSDWINEYVQDNIHAMCSSKEFIQNPKNAIISWLINGFEGSIMGGAPEEQAFCVLMKCIPNFEEVATVEYLEAFGERYFAQSPTRDQCMEILKRLLNTSSTQGHLERFIAFHNRAKDPAEDPRRCFIYAEAAQTDLQIALKAFRHAEQLRTDELVHGQQAEK